MEKIKRLDLKIIRETESPAVRLALVSLILCGLVFPLVVTGFAQALFPAQANGSLDGFHNRTIGSDLIAQDFNRSNFFQPRSDSASGVDPHITLDDAYSQIPRISAATNGTVTTRVLENIVNQNVEGRWWIFGSPYVNVLRLNIILVDQYPTVYNIS
ncbi:MAG TPA: potassium-transporting ATPase subunit C [Candidatus Binatus sp.]|nr:potassium-transporting ATPase subunit C [Candidatus Binatus sp.]